jgi:quinol monooxygenase YgiN
MMSTNVKVMAAVTALPGKGEALKALLLGMIAPSRAEPGNLRYDLWEDQSKPGSFVFDELYADSAAVAAHRASAHFQSYLASISELATRTALVLAPIDVA